MAVAYPLMVAQAGNGSSAIYAVDGFHDVRIQVFSAGTSSASVAIEARADPSAPFTNLTTITNPTGGATGGAYYSLPKTHQIRLTVSSYVSGTISAFLEAWVSDFDRSLL